MKFFVAMENLTTNDKEVLNLILNPLEPLGIPVCSVNSVVNEDLDIVGLDDSLKLDEITQKLVKQAVNLSEIGKFEEALEIFKNVIRQFPNIPSLFNDRAQALRLAGKNEEAMEDLHHAVKLSNGKSKSGIKALCQRGILHRLMGDETRAKEDFEAAAKNGSKFAKAQLAALNPYAKMCNAMLQKVMTKNYKK